VLAYQCVQFLRVKLKAAGITHSWVTLRDILSVQRRVTATFNHQESVDILECCIYNASFPLQSQL
jgi:hypothetical protein